MVVWLGVFVGSSDGVVVMDVVATKVSDTVTWMDCVFLVADGDTVGTSDMEGVVGSVDVLLWILRVLLWIVVVVVTGMLRV